MGEQQEVEGGVGVGKPRALPLFSALLFAKKSLPSPRGWGGIRRAKLLSNYWTCTLNLRSQNSIELADKLNLCESSAILAPMCNLFCHPPSTYADIAAKTSDVLGAGTFKHLPYECNFERLCAFLNISFDS